MPFQARGKLGSKRSKQLGGCREGSARLALQRWVPGEGGVPVCQKACCQTQINSPQNCGSV